MSDRQIIRYFIIAHKGSNGLDLEKYEISDFSPEELKNVSWIKSYKDVTPEIDNNINAETVFFTTWHKTLELLSSTMALTMLVRKPCSLLPIYMMNGDEPPKTLKVYEKYKDIIESKQVRLVFMELVDMSYRSALSFALTALSFVNTGVSFVIHGINCKIKYYTKPLSSKKCPEHLKTTYIVVDILYLGNRDELMEFMTELSGDVLSADLSNQTYTTDCLKSADALVKKK